MGKFKGFFKKLEPSHPKVETRTEISMRVLGHEVKTPDEDSDEIDTDAWFAEAEREFNERRTNPPQSPAIPWDEQLFAINLVKNAKIRDLDRAEAILSRLWETADKYEPGFCTYAELFYKRGEFKRSAVVALEAHSRALASPEWAEDPPPAPLNLAAKAYRALGRQSKKAGDLDLAAHYYQQVVDLDRATKTDLKTWAQLSPKGTSQ